MTVGVPGFDPRPITLRGGHAMLEPIAPAHAADLARAGADPSIWDWMPARPPADEAGRRAFFDRWVDEALGLVGAGEAVVFVTIDTASGRIVGSTRIMSIRRVHRGAEVGWTWLAPEAQRTAINTEAKLLLLGHLFDGLGAVRVELKTDHRNERSQRAIERIGAVREGALRAHMLRPDGTRRDSVYYSILDTEWPAVRRGLRARLGHPIVR